MNLKKHVWEGWLVEDFIKELEPLVKLAICGEGYFKTISTKEQLKEFCKDHQPYYKKHIPEVYNYFKKLYYL